VPLFLVLAVVAYITLQFAANERDAQAWVRHTYQVMEAERLLQDDIQTAEISERGYVISRRPEFLTAYRDFVARAPADLKAFRDLTSDNPVQQARADRLQRMLDQRLRGLDAGAPRPRPRWFRRWSPRVRKWAVCVMKSPPAWPMNKNS